MKKIVVILFLFFNCSIYSQEVEYLRIYNDTSLYFIHQIDSLHPVSLSLAELAAIEEHLVKAINEFNRTHQQYIDSINPQNKKRKYKAQRINIDTYFFQFIPIINKEGEKEVWINGDCKSWFKTGTGKKTGYDPDWKKKFIDGQMIDDGGSCFIYLQVNLTLKTHNALTMNSEG